MSRLDDLIHRFCAQRDVLNLALQLLKKRKFPASAIAVELGLGSGRTYDHLRSALGDRALFAFDYKVETHPGYEPPPERVVLGDILETFPRFAAENPGKAYLLHLDIGSKDLLGDRRRYAELLGWVESIAAPGALILSDRELSCPLLQQIDLTSLNLRWPYFAYERAAAQAGTSITSSSEVSRALNSAELASLSPRASRAPSVSSATSSLPEITNA